MFLFDWLHDVRKGKDTIRPMLIKIGIAIIIIGVLLSIWNYFN